MVTRRKNKANIGLGPLAEEVDSLQQLENEQNNNNIDENEPPVDEEKDEVIDNDLHDDDDDDLNILNNNNDDDEVRSRDPPGYGSPSSEQRRQARQAARLDAAAEAMRSNGSNGGRNKSTQVSDHTNHDQNGSQNNRSRDPAGHRTPKSKSSKSKSSKSKKSSSDTLSQLTKNTVTSAVDRRFQKQDDKFDRLEQQLQLIATAVGVKFPEPAVVEASSSIRDAVDLAPVKISSQGTRLTTAPVLLRQNDTVYWQYSGDMMKHVTVIKIDPPNVNRRMPVYTVTCNDNGQENIVLHNQLFVTEDTATKWDSDGRITSDVNLLSATDRMDLYAMGPSPYTTFQATQWANMDGSKFKLSTMQTALKDVTLDSDSLVELKRLHDILSSAVTGASTTGLLALPKLSELSPAISIRTVWLPPARHPQFPTAMACFTNIANVISTTLTNKDFAKKAPKARFAISTVAKTLDGIDMLDHLYKSRIPMLGATDFNPYVEIMSLRAENKMMTIAFISKAQDIQAQLLLSSHPPTDNTLFKQFLEELMKTNLHSYISSFFTDFNQFSKACANTKLYTKHTVDTVSRFLIDGKAPEILYLNDKVNSIPGHDVNEPSPFNNAHARHKSRSNFSRPKFAAMQLESSELAKEIKDEANDDGTVGDNEFECTEEELRQAEEQVAPYFEKIMETYSGDADSLHKDLVFTAMETIKQSRKPCEVCTETHPADRECWYRGPDFQPDWLRKRVEQINMRDGDKPKNDPNRKVIPPKASFSKKPTPQYRSMQLSSSDSDKANDLLNEIESKLQTDLSNDSISPTPMMSSLKLSSGASTNAPRAIGQAEIQPAADYFSVYSQQDFC